MSHSPILLVTIALPTTAMGAMAAKFYKEMHYSGDTAVTKMRLRSEQTLKDFKILFYAITAEALATLAIGTGGLTANNLMINFGRGLTALVAVAITIVMYRWTVRVHQ